MPASRSKQTRRTRSQWTEILRRFESSRLDSREFCRRESLALSSFQRWHRRLGSVAAGEFVDLVPTSSPSVAPASWLLDVSLPNGVSLRFQG
jgi:hypothetical protein